MTQERDAWARAREATREEVRAIFARDAAGAEGADAADARDASTAPAGGEDAARSAPHERAHPLPPLLLLPARGWRALSPRGRRIAAAIGLGAVAAAAAAIPFVEEGKREGAALERREAAAALAAETRRLREDQRPRRAAIAAADRRRVIRLGGLRDPAAAALVGARIEAGIEADVARRIRAGLLEGPTGAARCTPVRVRTARTAHYNCQTIGASRRVHGRTIEVGYRFTGRADLGAGLLLWCKVNPPPLHPTSYVVKVPRAPECV